MLTLLCVTLNELFTCSANFIERLQTDECKLKETAKMKLLNVNAYARLFSSNYKGPFLNEDSDIYNVTLKHSKQKFNLANGMIDALKNLLPANNHVKSFVDTKMGFLIGGIVFIINIAC